MRQLLLKIAKTLARWAGYELSDVLLKQVAQKAREEYEVKAKEKEREIKELRKHLLFGSPVLPAAVELIEWQDKVAPKDASGESKRHNVYAKLIKLFPDVDRRHLARAIELSICLE